MQPLCCFTLSLLCSVSLLSFGLSISIECNETQYAWPSKTPEYCCNRCPPGQHMVRRSLTSCHIECAPCKGNWFTDSYNVAMYCSVCGHCNKKPNMEQKSNCTATRNTECRCKAGYRCDDHLCTNCVLIPPHTKPTTLPTSAPVLTTFWISPKPIRDTVWLLVITGLLCAGIALVVVAKIKPFLQWIRANHGYFLADNPSVQPPCAVDEEVSKPVQEVCGKCDQLIDICVKD